MSWRNASSVMPHGQSGAHIVRHDAAPEHKRGHALGIRRGEEDGSWARPPTTRRWPPGTSRRHPSLPAHRPCAPRGRLPPHTIRHARPALVEEDQPRERGEPATHTRRRSDCPNRARRATRTRGHRRRRTARLRLPGTRSRRRRSSCSASRVARGVVWRVPSSPAAYLSPRGAETGGDHRRGGPGLPQLQRPLPRLGRARGGRVHGDADPEHRRPRLSGRACRVTLSGRDPDPARGGARTADPLEHGVDEAVFSYSDVSHEHVMHVASRALAAGADFRLVAPCVTELDSSMPCVAICAVRTGAGKSQTRRRVTEILRDAGHRVAVLRHPMPYGDLTKQAVAALRDATTTSRPPTARSRSARSTSRTSPRAISSSPASITRGSSSRQSRRRT